MAKSTKRTERILAQMGKSKITNNSVPAQSVVARKRTAAGINADAGTGMTTVSPVFKKTSDVPRLDTGRKTSTTSKKTITTKTTEVKTTQTNADDRLAQLKSELAKREASGDMGGTTLLRQEINRLNTQQKYNNASYEDNFTGQFKASYAQGRLSQDEAKAWNDYLSAPTAANRKKAEQASAVLKQFQERNKETLKNDAKVPILSQSLAGYLPQLADQVGASIKGGMVGAGAGSAIPVVGTAMGAKAGITAANAAHSYSLMRGSAFKELLDLGVDEEVAKQAASDEAVISALIEMGDTILDVSGIGLGVGSLISVAQKGTAKLLAKKGAEQAAETAAKKLLKAVGKYGLNVAQEAAEEGTQQAVSIANRNRTLAGKTGGAAELAGQSIKTLGKAVTGKDMAAREEILQAAGEGAKIAAVMGAGGTILQQGTDYALNKAAGGAQNKGKGKTQTPAEVARQAVQMPQSEAVESMNSETQQAVDRAQNVAYNENVKADNVTVLNRGATLYAQLGMKRKKAEAKAAVVQKVVEGKTITTEELKSLNLTDPKARDVFTQLTGYVFPDNTKVLEDRATQMAHMKRVPEVMAENARVQNEVAAAQARVNVAETAAAELVESVSPAQVSEDITQPENGVQAVQEAVEVAEERDPGEGPADFDTFAHAYRERVNSQATEAEIKAEYAEYQESQEVFTLPNGAKLNRSGLKGLVYQNTGVVPTDAELEQLMGELRKAEQARTQQNTGAKENTETESAAQSESAEAPGEDLRSTLPETTQKVIDYAERKLGVKIFIDRKVAGPKGKKIRGSNNSKLREIHIAVDAKGDLSHGDVILQVLRHELTHYLRDTSPDAYADFVKFVTENMDDYRTRYDAKAKTYAGVISANDRDAINDELAAEYAEKLFTDEELIDMIARTDRSLAEKILDAIKEVLNRLTGEELTEAQATARKAQKLWEKALEKAAVKAQADGLVVNRKGDPVAQHHDNGTTQFSLSTYEEQGRAYLADWLKKAIGRKSITAAEAEEITAQMDAIYEICQEYKAEYAPFGSWSDAKVAVDEDGKPVFSVVKSNGDYAMNLDFSLVCKKRRALDAVFNEMVRTGAINDFNIGQEEIVKINDIIRKHGFETACALCFVDARRFRQGDVADTFVAMYNDLVKSMIPEGSEAQAGYFNFGQNESLDNVESGIDTLADEQLDLATLKKTLEENGAKTVPYKIAKHLLENPGDRKLVDRGDFMSTAGFNAVKKDNPALLSLFNAKKGSGGPKAAFGDVQYLSDILKRSGWTPKKAFAVGGVRVQSFSDYVPRLVFDYVQMMGDLAAKKLPAQAYTKEALFVKQFGLTGMKINMSLIPRVEEGGIAPGLDANGNYVWADESFDYETALQIQNAEGYSRNCGTICVGVSYEHIRTLMADDNIRMVIPYHKSGLNPVVAKMNHIAEFTDYTDSQNTRHSDGKKLDKDVAGDKKLLKEEPQFNEVMRKLNDPRAAAEQYVRWCEENDLLPKFDQFAYRQIAGEYVINDQGQRVVDENYYKLLEDFSVYDNGAYAPQTAVSMVFPTEDSAFGSMKELIKTGLEEDAVTEGKRLRAVPEIVKEIRETLGAEEGTQYSFEEGGELDHLNLPTEVIFGTRYNELKNNGDIADYDKAKKGDVEAALRLIQKYVTEEDVAKIAAFGDHVYLLPIQNDSGKSSNVIPLTLGSYISEATGQSVLDGVYQADYLNRRSKGNAARLTSPDVRFDVADEVVYNTLKGAKVVGIDDNTSYGSTLRGLAKFLQEHDAEMVGAYVLTVGGDNSEAMVVTDSTWRAIEKEGVENVERYAREQGYSDAFTREHLGERRAQDFLALYQKDKGRGQSHDRKKPRNHEADQTVHEGQQSAPQTLPRTEAGLNKVSKASDEPGAFSMPTSDPDIRYSVSDDPYAGFKNLFNEMYGEGAADTFFENAKAAYAEAQEQAKNVSAKASGSVAQADDGMTGWVIYGRNPESVGAARLGFDPYSYLQNKYGTIEQTGRSNHRIVDVPKSTDGRDKVSKTTSTVMGAKATPDDRLETIAQAVVDGKMSYYPVSNKITENKMRRKIEKDGWEESLKNWTSDVRAGKANADLVAMGATLLNNAGNSGMGGREYTALMMDYAQLLRNAGQALQAANIFKKMSPEAKLYGVQKQIDRINEDADIRTRSTGIPVDLWMDRVGELLADKIYERIDVKEDRARVDTVCDTILKDLYAYAKDLVAKESTSGKPVRTEMERLQDLFRNKDKYKEAWQIAKNRLFDEFGTGSNVYAALEAWIKDELPLAKRLTKELTGQNEIVMSEALAEMYLAAETDEQRDAAMELILQNIADQIPATKMDKFTALRYTAMLGNLRTNVRNVAGNVLMQPVRLTKTTFAGLAEALIQKAGVDMERTTSVKRDKETLKAAKADFQDVRDIIAGGGKYKDDRSNVADEIRKRQRIFKNALLEGARKGTSWLMDNDYFGDGAFSSFTYSDALARYIAANGTTWSQASPELKDKARAVAIREAAEATYRDNNALSEAITKMRFRNPKTGVEKGINLVAEGIMPFRKTPANILVRAVEYSPLGIATSMVQSVRAATNKNDLTAADLINSFSKGLTGTGIILAGMGLASIGALKGKGPEDEKEKELWEMQGHQDYSLEIDGTSFTIDWAAPLSIPLLVGAELHEALLSEGLTVREAGSVASAVFDPLLEMSMLQGINDAISNAQTYGDESALVRFVGNALWSYVTQPIPTLLGQVERAGDNTRMTTYADKNADVPDAVQRALGKASAKIPGWDYAQVQYIDAWGRTQKNADTQTMNVIEQFVSPGYISTIKETKMEKELVRLYEATGDSGVLISSAPKYFTVSGERKDLTAGEYLTYAKTRGQTAFNLVTEITGSTIYARMDDKTKAAVVAEAYNYANQIAKELVTDGAATVDKWVQEARVDAAQYNIPVSTYLSASVAVKGLSSIKDENGETVTNSKSLRVLDALYSIPGLSETQVKKMAEDFDVGKKVIGYNSKMVKSKLDALEKKYEKYN